jgi:hypothetical protein
MKQAIFRPTPLAPAAALLLTMTLCAAAPLAAAASEPSEFDWSGPVARGATVEVVNPNGDVFVQRSDDGNLSVRTMSTATSGDAGRVSVRTQTLPNGILLCTQTPGANGACASGSDPAAEANAAFHVDELVQVPAGVNVSVRGRNGKIVIEDAGAAVSAVTLNGDIHVSLATVAAGAPMTFHTRNGSISIQAPPGSKLYVKADASGGVQSTFPSAPEPGLTELDAHADNGSVSVVASV